MNNLSALYRSSLHATAASTQSEREDAFRLRYQVYCVERGFEPSASFDCKSESDRYDDRAIHLLSRHRASGNVLGVTRLVPDDHQNDRALPIENHHLESVQDYLTRMRRSGMIRMAEISRLAVTRDINGLCDQRQRAYEPGTAGIEAIGSRIKPQHVSMGLLAILFRQSLELGITHWVALADSNLLRCYGRLGIQCHKIGPEVDFRGPRQPMVANIVEVWNEVQRRCPPLANLIKDLPAGNAGKRPVAPHVPTVGQQVIYGDMAATELVAACA